MAGSILWQSGAVISFAPQLSGQGAQVTNGVTIQLSGDIFNNGASGGPCFFAQFEFIAAASGFGAAITAGQTIDLYLAPARDGANPVTASTSGQQFTTFRGSFVSPISGNTPRLALSLEGIPLLPERYRAWITNNMGQTMTSGWSVFCDLFNEAYT